MAASNAKRRKQDKDDVKADIVRYLENLSTSSTVAMGRLEPSIPHQPLLKIEGYGTVGLPVNERAANDISQFMEEAPYGLGEETVLDKNVRDTLQIGPNNFHITNMKFSQAVLGDVVNTVKLELGLQDMEVWAEPYKLLLYKPGGHFKPHRDTEKAAGMFGTLIVQLPSEFTGGDLVVRHGGKNVVVKMSQEGCSSSCVVAAHYSDCEHEVTPVLTGCRLVLVYSLCWRGAGQAPSAEEMLSKATSLKPLLSSFSKEIKNSGKVCWGLEHLYSDNAVKIGGSGALKGNDRAVVETLLTTSHMLEKEEQLEVFLAKASQSRQEYGQCEYEGRGRRYGGWFDRHTGKDCFEYDDCNEVEIKLTDFISLAGGEVVMEDDTFNAEENVLNFDDEEEFWGEGAGECSGPSGNAGATRDMWYHRWVAVMWRKEDSFMIKFQASHVAGLQHILNTCQEGDMVKAKEEVEKVLSKHLENSCRMEEKIVEAALDLSFAIDDENICSSIMDKFLTSKLVVSESVLAKLSVLVTKYTWPALKPNILKLLEKADSISKIAGIAKLFSVIGITDVSVCQQVLSKMKTQGGSHSNTSTSLTSVLDLMLKFPTEMVMLGKELASLPCMSTLDTIANLSSHLATILAKDKAGVPVLNALEEMFLCKAGKQSGLGQNSAAVTKMLNVMVQQNRETSVQSLSRIVLGQPGHQSLLSSILSSVSAATVPMSPALLVLVRARVASLHPLVTRGPPAFSWRQSSAVVPGHPRVQEFFRGDQQQFTYREFSGIRHARNWARKHGSDKGTGASFTPGGVGGNAYVEIVKNKEFFKKVELGLYSQKLKEYQRLSACLPVAEQPSTSSEGTIDLTED